MVKSEPFKSAFENLAYQASTRIEVKIEDETVWFTQAQMVQLFNSTKQNISLHIQNIFKENELTYDSTVKEYLTVQQEGLRKIKRNENVKTTIYTGKISQQLQLDIEKHNKQYPPIEIKHFVDAHDRFLIIDRSELYHIGASLKDLGKKWFAFSRMDTLTELILNRLN